MALTDDNCANVSQQAIGAITRDELNEHTFNRIERAWGNIIKTLLASSESADMTRLPIYVPEVLKHMVADVHFNLTIATRAISASMIEYKQKVALYDEYISDVNKMNQELQPLYERVVADPNFVEDDWYDIMHPDPTRSFEIFKQFFLPISQSKLKAWAEFICLKKAWIEHLVLTHCYGRAYLRALKNQCLMFDAE